MYALLTGTSKLDSPSRSKWKPWEKGLVKDIPIADEGVVRLRPRDIVSRRYKNVGPPSPAGRRSLQTGH